MSSRHGMLRGMRYGMLRGTRSSIVAAAIAASLLAAPWMQAAEPGDAGASSERPAAPQKCLEAVVSPVSGFAECVNPRGAPVEQPHRPEVPCAQRVPGPEADQKPCFDEPLRAPGTNE